jgi:probable phosphoglycerate mutase
MSAGDETVPKKIYLVRHAQSVGNAEGRIQGWFDSPLNELGRRQADVLARRLAAEASIDAIFASPLQRAAETAQIVGRVLNRPVIFEDDLREYNMGPISGLTLPEIEEQFPERLLAFKENRRLPHLPGEEGEAMFMERVRLGMENIIRQISEGQSILVVSHGGTLNACLRQWLGVNGYTRHPFRIENASVTLVEINEIHKQVVYLNDTCHLATIDQTGKLTND